LALHGSKVLNHQKLQLVYRVSGCLPGERRAFDVP
jgi:hypothetical protein